LIGWFIVNPNAIHLLEANPEEIDWGHLSANPNAIHLLEEESREDLLGLFVSEPKRDSLA
jgi:hypothetical protein